MPRATSSTGGPLANLTSAEFEEQYHRAQATQSECLAVNYYLGHQIADIAMRTLL